MQEINIDTLTNLYQTYGGMVFRRCLKLLKNDQDALDCMQDIFLSVTRNFESVEYPSSYLYRMATNHSLNRIRDRKCHPESDIDDIVAAIASAEETDQAITMNSIIEKIFNGQQESTRVIAMLHFYDGYTLEEVAEMVNMSLSGVRKRLRSLKEDVLKRGLKNE